MEAVSTEHNELIGPLIDHGADPALKDSKGRTAAESQHKKATTKPSTCWPGADDKRAGPDPWHDQAHRQRMQRDRPSRAAACMAEAVFSVFQPTSLFNPKEVTWPKQQ